MNRIKIYSGFAALLTVLFFYQNRDTGNKDNRGSKRTELTLQNTIPAEPYYPLDTTLNGSSGIKRKQEPRGPGIVNTLFVIEDKAPQQFTIDNSKDTILTCMEGTKITIPANAFINKRTGMPGGIFVSVNVKEYYSNADIILAGLSTRSGNDMLETGGMIHVDAIANNESCILKTGKQLKIFFPYTVYKENMQLFKGEMHKGHIDWVLPKEAESVCEPDTDTNIVYDFITVQEQAEFGEDVSALHNYIRSNIKYPQAAIDSCIKGKVYVQFYIEPNGQVNNICIRRGVHPLLDQEAMRMVAGMPKWKPAKQNGRSVRQRYIIPVNFLITGCPPYWSAYTQAYYQKMLDTTNVNKSTLHELNGYVMQASDLGWINCDRFVDRTKTELMVSNENNTDEWSARMVFKNIRSVMPADFSTQGEICFRNVPTNEPVIIIAFKRRQGKTYMAVKTCNTSDRKIRLDYTEATVEEIRKQAALLGEQTATALL